MTNPDDEGYDGPAILEGLRDARAAIEAGDTDEGNRIVDELREQHGDVPVDAIFAGLRMGFISLDPVDD